MELISCHMLPVRPEGISMPAACMAASVSLTEFHEKLPGSCGRARVSGGGM
jgi:hypothetical protein